MTRCAECHFSADDYRKAADFVVENGDTATAANMLRNAADDLRALSDRVEAAEKELEHLRFTHEGCIEIAADMERERDAETRRAVAAEKGRDEAWAAVNDQHAAYVGERGLRRAAEERVAALEKAARRCIDVVHDESVADYAACGRISVILGNALSSPASPNTEATKPDA